jgi:hypothetical protein
MTLGNRKLILPPIENDLPLILPLIYLVYNLRFKFWYSADLVPPSIPELEQPGNES